jgi:hypothetical protein
MAPRRGNEPTMSFHAQLPVSVRTCLDRMQQRTGKSATSLVSEALRLLDEQLKIEAYAAKEDYDNRDLAKAIAEAE